MRSWREVEMEDLEEGEMVEEEGDEELVMRRWMTWRRKRLWRRWRRSWQKGRRRRT